jgi:cytoskeletal protein CcmA (bactofilin family)
VLGASARMIGTLTTDGSVSLSDHFEGSILAGGSVLLGPQARLDGDLVCDTVIVEGQVRGNVTARQVSVLSSGQVLGDLCIEKLATEEGSVVQGMVTLQDALDIDEVRRVAVWQADKDRRARPA